MRKISHAAIGLVVLLTGTQVGFAAIERQQNANGGSVWPFQPGTDSSKRTSMKDRRETRNEQRKMSRESRMEQRKMKRHSRMETRQQKRQPKTEGTVSLKTQ